MTDQYAIVVTTINHPTRAVTELQENAHKLSAKFYLIGDSKSPKDFSLPGAEYFDLDRQLATGLKFAKACPTKHYARKNLGYLIAAREGSNIIVETDDDNIPREGFWTPRQRRMSVPTVTDKGWCNAYSYFADGTIWPRGLPLDRILAESGARFETLPVLEGDFPIQQGLADDNPDVDAIYRLVLPLPVTFHDERIVGLDAGVWSPFNSQNTTWWREAFPLLYLPYYCSFRMTDIWRSFIAQRIAWECGWKLLFDRATVFQIRNDHDLMRDFAEEVPGYLNNEKIRRTLEALPLKSGKGAIAENLMACYKALIDIEVVGAEEITLLSAWLSDLEAIG
jgi:hypothetical protein